MTSQIPARIAFFLILSYASAELQLRAVKKREVVKDLNNGEPKQIFSRSKRARDTTCPGDNMVVSGARYQDLNGWYEERSAMCSGKPTYSKYSRKHRTNVYLYAGRTREGGADWNIGNTLCSDRVSAFVLSRASTPDKINGNWYEFNTVIDRHVSNTNMYVTCGALPSAVSTVMLVFATLLSSTCFNNY